MFDAIFAVDYGSSIKYVKVISVERNKEPETDEQIWLTIYLSGKEERYMSRSRAAKFDEVMRWEQSRPNDAQ